MFCECDFLRYDLLHTCRYRRSTSFCHARMSRVAGFAAVVLTLVALSPAAATMQPLPGYQTTFEVGIKPSRLSFFLKIESLELSHPCDPLPPSLPFTRRSSSLAVAPWSPRVTPSPSMPPAPSSRP